MYFMMQKRFLSLLVILLAVSYLLSATAIPGSRTQRLNREDKEALLPLAQVDAENSEVVDLERRMDLETQDYGGTGANKDHDPNPPGGV